VNRSLSVAWLYAKIVNLGLGIKLCDLTNDAILLRDILDLNPTSSDILHPR
jgi:hypothetical protein